MGENRSLRSFRSIVDRKKWQAQTSLHIGNLNCRGKNVMRVRHACTLSALAIALSIVAPRAMLADTIVQNSGAATPGFPGTFNFIGYNSSNVAFGQNVPSQFLEFGGRFHPS